MAFGDIFKRVKEEVEKRARQQEPQKQPEKPTEREVQPERIRKRRGYGRLIAWLKSNYGRRFRDGSTTAEVQNELEKIYKELDAKGDFKQNPKIIKGWRAYIDGRQYGDLVKVSQ
jgi:hypothetical protein